MLVGRGKRKGGRAVIGVVGGDIVDKGVIGGVMPDGVVRKLSWRENSDLEVNCLKSPPRPATISLHLNRDEGRSEISTSPQEILRAIAST
jgi:hypothetical protein